MDTMYTGILVFRSDSATALQENAHVKVYSVQVSATLRRDALESARTKANQILARLPAHFRLDTVRVMPTK
jgi:hypothetical protein